MQCHRQLAKTVSISFTHIVVSHLILYPNSYNCLIFKVYYAIFLSGDNTSKQITLLVINHRMRKKQTNQKTCTFFKLASNKLYHDISVKIVSILTNSSMVDYFPP